MSPGRLPASPLGALLAVLGSPLLPAQEARPAPGRDDRVAEVVQFFNQTSAGNVFIDLLNFDQESPEVMVLHRGGVAGSFTWPRPDGPSERARLFADRVLVMARYRKAGSAGAGDAGRGSLGPPRLFAEGNVRIEVQGAVLEADEFLYDDENHRGLAVGARARAELSAVSRLGGLKRRSE
ncbi:MAG: hypothetical protein ACRD2T_05875, partial [Thermoanaerobaculia bacterium]